MEKLAYPKMFRGEDGRQKVQYIDLETGDPVTNLEGYRIVTGGGTDYYDPTPDGTDTDADEHDLNPDPKASAAQRSRFAEGGQKERQDAAGYSYATSQAAKSYKGANRGYINKPSWAKYANFLPGVAGLAAKGVNMAINANNVAAVNSARKAMGLDPVGVGGAIKGTLKDNQGNIARVQVGDGQYSVGFETLDKYGRTNMTPEEAMARARALGVDINELSNAKPAGTENKGLLTKAKEAVFGAPPTAPTQTPSPVSTTSKPTSTPATQTNPGSLASAGAPYSGTVDVGKPAGRPESTVQAAYGPMRPNEPTAVAKPSLAGGGVTVQDAAVRAVQDALGPNYSVVGTSGTEGSLAQFGSNRHKTGLALDFGVKDNLTGKMVTDQNKLAAVAEAFATSHPEANIGLGPNYMGGVAIHADLTGFGGVKPGQGETWGGYPGLAGLVANAKENPITPNFAYEAPTARPMSPEEQVAVSRQMTDSILGGPMGLSPAMYSQAVLDNMSKQTTVASRPETPIGSLPGATPSFTSMVAGRPETPVGSLSANKPSTMSPTFGVKDDNLLGMSQAQIAAAFERVDNPGTNIGLQAAVSRTNPAFGTSMTPGVPDFSRNTVRPSGPVGSLPASPTSFSPTLGTKDDAVMTRDQYAMARDGAFHAIADLGIPGPSPASLASAQQALGADLSPTAHTSVFSGQPGPSASAAKSMLTNTVAPSTGKFNNVDLSTASPAQMASLGLINRTEEDRNAMARAIAGELGPASLKALAANDPTAQREVANMIASMENRLATEKYGTVASMLSPSQYNSLMAENLGVTDQNYGLYGKNISDVMNGFYTGAVKPDNFGITNYYNPDIADPNWGKVMDNPTYTGQHVFGGLPGDYAPGSTFTAMRDAYSKAQISDTRGFTPSLTGTSLDPNYSSGSMATARAADRGSVQGYSGQSSYSSSIGSMAQGRASDRDSVAGYAGGSSGGDRASGIAADRGSVAGYSGGSSGGDRASGVAADRGSVSGYSGGSSGGGGYTGGGPTSGPSSGGSGYTGGGPTSGPSSSSSGGNNTSWGGTGEKL